MRAAFAALICIIAIGSFAGDLLFLDFFGPGIFVTLPLLSFAIVGSVLVVRRAGGPIGWLLGAAGAIVQLGFLLSAYAYASLEGGAASPGGALALWVLSSFMATTMFGLVVATLVLFPDGRPPTRAFAILLWVLGAIVAVVLVGGALADRPIDVPQGPRANDPPRFIANPFASHGPLGDLMLLAASAIRLFPALALIAPAALVVRFRRSRGVEREQLKWPTYTAAITFGLLLVGFVSPPGPIPVVAQTMSLVGVGLLPVAIGIAVTRYRLYDIDVLIRRTVVYGAVSAALVATYLGAAVLFQAVLRPLTSGSELAVAGSTLLVVALFQPFRSRIQGAVDRRFYRSRYDAARTLDAFGLRLRNEVDLDSVRADLLDVVRDTVRPAHASVWLRERAR